MNQHPNNRHALTTIIESENLSPIKCDQPDVESLLYSPMSQIVRDMDNSSLSSDSHEMDTRRYYNMENNKLLFKHVFNIRGTPESGVRQRLRNRRSMDMALRRLSSSESLSLSMDKENGSASCSPLAQHLSSLKMGNGKLLKYSRLPLEDCDPNSQGSGYSALGNPDNELAHSSNRNANDGFQFAEPSGVAPRRTPVDPCANSPSNYNHTQRHQYSSSLRPYHSSPSVITKISSGYASMDDGFNELNDIDNVVENNEQQQRVTVPNGITDLLSGDIVTLSNEKPMECDGATTPEFPRVRPVRVRRSLSMQIDHEDNSSPITPSISKVRACLFRSPNATSSAGKLTFNENNPKANSPSPPSMLMGGTCGGGVRRKMFASPNYSPQFKPSTSFKRPEPPTDESPILVKRSKKTVSFRKLPEESSPQTPTAFSRFSSEIPMEIVEKKNIEVNPLNRCRSESDAHAIIKSAIHRSTTDADLTGDFSKTCILPLEEGHHNDLKSISSETLAKLICGEFNHCIDEFKIVDCRYPYEYEAGHIEGAINLYTKELIDEFITNPLNKMAVIEPEDKKRNILIFHCEFSWERGPNLSRYLRNIDRKLNKELYPALHFPEIYLLHGGYQQFYRLQKHLCSPQGYRPMTDPNHEADLRKFRSKSKSWQGEKSRTNGFTARANLKRLGL